MKPPPPAANHPVFAATATRVAEDVRSLVLAAITTGDAGWLERLAVLLPASVAVRDAHDAARVMAARARPGASSKPPPDDDSGPQAAE